MIEKSYTFQAKGDRYMFVTKFVELVRGERVLINEVKFGITTTGGKDGPYNNSKRFRGVTW